MIGRRLKFIGPPLKCEALVTTADSFLRRVLKRSVPILEAKLPLPSGDLIEVQLSNTALPLVTITVKPSNPELPPASLFQCDMFTDDPEFPEEIDKQVKTSIFFSVKDNVYWDYIPERQGNAGWYNEGTLVTWDGVQNWSRPFINKKAWNDGIGGPNGETLGWPYGVTANFTGPARPIHPVRQGEITTIVNAYADNNITVPERSSFGMNFALVFEPNDDNVMKQYFFVNGKRIDVNLPFGNQYIVGACVGKAENGKVWYVIITHAYSELSPTIGIESYAYDDVWYIDPEDETVTPIKIHTVYYSSNDGADGLYETSKAHITSWDFNDDGTKGVAFRSEQYFITNVFEWGPYSDPRISHLDLTYTHENVTAESRHDTSVTEAASTVTPGGVVLNDSQKEEWINTYQTWMDNFRLNILKFPTDRYFGALDVQYDSKDFKGFGVSSKIVESSEIDTDTLKKVTRECYIQVSNAGKVIYSKSYTGTKTAVYRSDGAEDFLIVSDTELVYRPIGLHYLGGSPEYNIAFFVETIVDANIRSRVSYSTQGDIDDTNCLDQGYSLELKLICVFNGVENDIGSPIKVTIPARLDKDEANSTFISSTISTSGVAENGESGWHSMGSNFPWYGLQSGSTYFSHSSPGSSHVYAGDFGGSIKVAKDGSHAVISCSYMDIAKYIYPWHRFSFDVNETTYVNRWDTMDKVGIDVDLQEAWNKYMINYAIIGHSEDTEQTSSTGGLTSYGGDGTSINSAVLGVNNEDVVTTDIKQLSNLLFGKQVESEPLGKDSQGNNEYEFGIKDKDTTVFLPIGLYADPEE